MTVAELIAELQKLPPDLPVYYEPEYGHDYPASAPKLGQVPVMMTQYPSSVDHYVPGVVLS